MKIVLREITIEDGSYIVKWRNDVKVIRHCIDKTVITEELNTRFFNDNITTGKVKQFIVERTDEEYGGIFAYPIGTIYFKDIDYQNHKCEIGMFPSDDDEWNSESQHIAVCLMIKKAYQEYYMNKVYVYVFADCNKEIELLTECGFVREGIFKSEILDNNNYRDVIRLAIFNIKE